MRLAIPLSLITALTLSLGGPAGAGEMAGVAMRDTIQFDDKQLTLNGMGLREATVLKVDVYVAGLYLEKVSSNPQDILASDQVKMIVLRFVRDVDRGDIVKAWNEGFAKNPIVDPAKIKGNIARLDSWMQDFKKGDTLTFIHVPGTGLVVDVGTARKGTIADEDFARSLFAIWLGPKPPSGSLKTGLLGRH